jgi:hypothetical protein
MTQGDLNPPLEVTLGDAAGLANFSAVTASMVTIIGVMNGGIVVADTADEVIASDDGKSMVVRRAWVEGDTDTPGRMWLQFVVNWTGSKPQSFPEDTPLRINIRRAI